MKNKKRTLAIIGIILLVSLYLVTLFSSFFATETSASLFKASAVCTILVPLLLYSYLMVCRVFRGKGKNEQSNDKDSENDISK